MNSPGDKEQGIPFGETQEPTTVVLKTVVTDTAVRKKEKASHILDSRTHMRQHRKMADTESIW